MPYTIGPLGPFGLVPLWVRMGECESSPSTGPRPASSMPPKKDIWSFEEDGSMGEDGSVDGIHGFISSDTK